MDAKKRTAILVTIALVLAFTAIIINVASSSEVPTEAKELSINAGSGEVGVKVLENNAEDKLVEESIK